MTSSPSGDYFTFAAHTRGAFDDLCRTPCLAPGVVVQSILILQSYPVASFSRPHPPPSLALSRPRLHCCLNIAGHKVGQWYKTIALVHLRGGYRPPGSSEHLTVTVQLEGFVTA